jgi:hypothetical protein
MAKETIEISGDRKLYNYTFDEPGDGAEERAQD